MGYYPFMVNLERYNGSCNTPNDPSNEIYVPNKTEDVNLSIFNMVVRINKSKTLTKHMQMHMQMMVKNVI